MDQRTGDGLSPYRIFTRAEWAGLREDTPMTLTPGEVGRLRSLHDRLDMAEVEEIYLPLSRLLALYVVAASNRGCSAPIPRLWRWTCSPGAIGTVAKPMIWP